MKFTPFLFLVGMSLVSSGRAALPIDSPLWIHLNGYSHHFRVDDANDALLGLGFTKYTDVTGRMVTAWEADVFDDSGRKPAGYIGYSWTARFPALSVGVTAAVMYHENFRAQNKLRVLPVAFPYLEIGGRALRLRAYYVPSVRAASDEQVAIQLMFPWAAVRRDRMAKQPRLD